MPKIIHPRVDVRFKNDDWVRDLQEAALNTVNKTYDDGKPLTPELFRRYLLSEHSPIRAVELRVTLYDVPYSIAMHFARHVHTMHYISTNRPDRTKRERTLEDKCNHIMDVNLQALIDMARKRLCVGKCDTVTYQYMKAIKDELIRKGDFYQVIGEMLVPNCVYRNGCPEFKPCGFNKDGNVLLRYAEYNKRVKKK